VNPTLIRPSCRFPDVRMNKSARSYQRAIHVYTDQPNR
jgi:hypothetical protein